LAALASYAVGKTYELAGPETHTLREILDLVLARKGRSCRFISIPFALASPLARVLELGFEELGITPQKLRDTISHLARPK
jgi:uncharacterized protein YbjT (DUF2867 family)